MQSTQFFNGNPQLVTLGSPTLQTTSRRVCIPIRMPLDGASFSGMPEWIASAYEAVSRYLAEECGETVQAVAKILRHGKHSCNPDVVYKGTNIEDLEKEVGDIFAVVEIMVRVKMLDRANIESLKAAKLERIFKYLHHNARLPNL